MVPAVLGNECGPSSLAVCSSTSRLTEPPGVRLAAGGLSLPPSVRTRTEGWWEHNGQHAPLRGMPLGTPPPARPGLPLLCVPSVPCITFWHGTTTRLYQAVVGPYFPLGNERHAGRPSVLFSQLYHLYQHRHVRTKSHLILIITCKEGSFSLHLTCEKTSHQRAKTAEPGLASPFSFPTLPSPLGQSPVRQTLSGPAPRGRVDAR